MKTKGKFIMLILLIIFTVSALTVFAVSEDEVMSAVEGSSKESVSGNLFIWFLCAVGFLKISQKIESFIASLGISARKTGGSMLGEAMIAARGIGLIMKTTGGFAGFYKGTNPVGAEGAGGAPAGKYGFFGGIGKSSSGVKPVMNESIQKNGGGIIGSVEKNTHTSFIDSGTSFASNTVTAKSGEKSGIGVAGGKDASAAFSSYFGYNKSGKLSNYMNEHNDISDSANINGGNLNISETGGDVISMPGIGGDESNPKFSNIEIREGIIEGIETSSEYPEGIRFAMYSEERFEKPEGSFDIMTAVDNSKWYKQYAGSEIEKTPHIGENGKISYYEKPVSKMPKPPREKG